MPFGVPWGLTVGLAARGCYTYSMTTTATDLDTLVTAARGEGYDEIVIASVIRHYNYILNLFQDETVALIAAKNVLTPDNYDPREYE